MHKHRHLVALPLFLALIGLSCLSLQPQSLPAMFVSGSEERFSLPSGIYGVLYRGSFEEKEGVLSLEDGDLVLSTERIATVYAGDAVLTLLTGSAYVSYSDGKLTVAGLNAPVAVLYGDQRMIVPSGMQWSTDAAIEPLTSGFALWMRARTPHRLPDTFMARKTQDLALVKQPRDVLERDDVDAREIAQLLSETTADQTPLRMQLLQKLVTDESLWMAASFHPAYQEIAWSMFGPDVSVESQLTRLFLLPFSALTQQEFSPFIFERYKASLIDVLTQVGDPVLLTEHIAQAHLPLISMYESLGYPVRARSLQETLLYLIEASPEVTTGMKEAKKDISAMQAIDVSSLPEVTPPEPEPEIAEASKEPTVVLLPEEVELAAYRMLSETSALFTVQTAITAFAPNQARVSDIVFSTATKDHSVSFTLDVVTGTVADIDVNGETNFPYAPTFESFIGWIKSDAL
ncbi:hypothetical protein H6770_03760 [Candidatus Peribacteria bacterium]|nr:hypothetical protein [Candidatus Peribacteria bacterium]